MDLCGKENRMAWKGGEDERKGRREEGGEQRTVEERESILKLMI